MFTLLYPNLLQIMENYIQKHLVADEEFTSNFHLKDILGCFEVLLFCVKHPKHKLPRIYYEFVEQDSDNGLNRAFDVLFEELTSIDN